MAGGLVCDCADMAANTASRIPEPAEFSIFGIVFFLEFVFTPDSAKSEGKTYQRSCSSVGYPSGGRELC